MKVTYTTTTSKIQVNVPFDLKDIFKEQFRTAKWNPLAKRWEINNNTRNLNKLTQWMASVEQSGIYETYEQLEEDDLTKKDIERLQSRLEQIKDEKRDLAWSNNERARRNEELKELKNKIDAAKSELDAERAKATAEMKVLEDERQELLNKIEKHISLTEVRGIHDEMCGMVWALKSGRNKVAKANFEECKDRLSKIQDTLEIIGVRSYGIDALVSANPNRMDRDDPNNITDREIEDFREID